MLSGSRLPHALRLTVFFLRLALGLHFAYLGFSALFPGAPAVPAGGKSLSALYTWLNVPPGTGSFPLFFQIAFLVIGICLLLGLFTRSVSFAAIALIGISYVPSLTFNSFADALQLLRDEVVFIICLLVLIVANAGTYLGVDNFIRFHFLSRRR